MEPKAGGSFKEWPLDQPYIWRPRRPPEFDSQGKDVTFYVRDGDGQWHHVSAAGTWEPCPPPVSENGPEETAKPQSTR